MTATTKVEWKVAEDGNLCPTLPSGKDVAWAPFEGSQTAFHRCPIYEALYEGTRGPGKTDCLLMDFGQHVGQGFGIEWQGVLFRQTFPQLADVIIKTKKWFPQIWGNRVKYNEQKATWTWSSGESLRFSYMKDPEDYWAYHGHSYPWIGWEELTTWPDDKCYKRMMSCSRSTIKGMPRKYRSTTNPYGPGHNWVRKRWRLPIPAGCIVGPVINDGPEGKAEPPRVAIHGHLRENIVMLHADPGYIDRIRAAASNSAELAAWLEGSWDITAGGMFDDIWDHRFHVIPNIPIHAIPTGWRIDRSYDHGQSKPFSVGWWAESNGEPLRLPNPKQPTRPFIIGAVRGDLIRIEEWYGWTGSDNEGVRMLSTEIGRGIIDREADWALTGRVRPGPADSSIFDQYEPGKSVAGDMAKNGVIWIKADKGPGSRRQGWEQIRKMLKGSLPGLQGIREDPGLFICERCYDGFIRTVPHLPRETRDMDDVDTHAEDHVGDEVRYRVRRKCSEVRTWRWQ